MAFIQGIVDTQKQNLKNLGIVNAGDDLTIELDVKEKGININFINPIFELLVVKADGTRVRQLVNISHIGNMVNIIGDEQLVTCPGIVTLQLLIKDNQRSSTCLFYFMCGTSLDRDIIQSIDKVEVLQGIDEYIVTAFSNLQEYEQRIIDGDASIRKLNEDIIAAEKNRNVAEQKRQETFEAKQKERESNYTAAEGDRNKKYTSSETDRDTQYKDAEIYRDKLYSQEKIDRNNKFNLEKKDRDTDFNNLKGEMESATNTSKNEEVQRALVFSDLREAMEFLKNTMTQNNNDMVDNEAERISAERQRQVNFETMQTDNSTFKDEINEQYAKITRKTGDIEKSYFTDETYNTGREALNIDLEHLNRKSDKSQLLPYEGSNISADRTYKGMTSDMEISGRTLRNLCDLKLGSYSRDSPLLCSVVTKLNMLKPNTQYIIKGKIKLVGDINLNGIYCEVKLKKGETFRIIRLTEVYTTEGTYYIEKEFTCDDDEVFSAIYFAQGTNRIELINSGLLILEKHDNINIPYFDGIQSVGEDEKIGDKYKVEIKSYGRNILNLKTNFNKLSYVSTLFIENGITFTGKYYTCFKLNRKYNKGEVIRALFNYKHLSGLTSQHQGFKVIYEDGSFSNMIKNGNSLVLEKDSSDEIVLYINMSENIVTGEFTNIQLEKIETNTTPVSSYEPYKEDKKQILLDQPLCGLQNLQNTINRKGVETRKIVKIVADNKLMCRAFQTNMWTDSIASFLIDMSQFGFPDYPEKVFYHPFNCLCNLFAYNENILSEKTFEGFTIRNASPNYIGFNVLKSKLSTVDESGFKKYLIDNNFECYVGLVEKLHKTINHNQLIELQTFDEKTYICSTNTLPAMVSCKVPSNTQALLQESRSKNVMLTNEVKTLKEENEQLNSTNNVQDELININMCATDEVFMMIEPILEVLPQVYSLKTKEMTVSKMVDMYVAMVMRGLKTIDEVPERYRAEVKSVLDKLEN